MLEREVLIGQVQRQEDVQQTRSKEGQKVASSLSKGILLQEEEQERQQT